MYNCSRHMIKRRATLQDVSKSQKHTQDTFNAFKGILHCRNAFQEF